MRFRLHGDVLHVHRCPDHPEGCDYFSDHTLAWMFGNRDAAKAQLMAYRASVSVRLSALSAILIAIDLALARLSALRI